MQCFSLHFDFIIQSGSLLLVADEPQPHLPVTAMTTQPSPEGLISTKPAPGPALVPKAAGHSAAEAPTGEAEAYSSIRGHPVGCFTAVYCPLYSYFHSIFV